MLLYVAIEALRGYRGATRVEALLISFSEIFISIL